ncbi:MAG: hypothetical protein IIY36_10945 [Lachnospiraceae bacterium]|nr:hypothetical protein [Lachnospiraceae bacterium]
MNRKLMTMLLAGLLVLSMSFAAYADRWVEENGRSKYERNNGTHVCGCWEWIDGDRDGIAECYCFDGAGILYENCKTPDGYTVDEMGRWTVDGVVQTKEVEIVVPETYAPAELTFHK